MSAQKGNILTYLPPEQRQRVLLLIQRLQEQSEAKNKLQVLYAQARTQINELQLRCNQLKDQNTYLKQQMHNSFSMIAQVRNQFRNNKQKRASEEQWQDEDEQENHLDSSNARPKLPKPNQKASIEKYRPQVTSADKTNSNILNTSSFLNQSNALSGSKKQEVDDLRRQVRALQLQKQKEEEKAKQITEKRKLVDEIKNRYRDIQDTSSKRKGDSAEKIEITDTFLNEDDQENYPNANSSLKKTNKIQDDVHNNINKKKQGSQKNERLASKSPYKTVPKPKEPSSEANQRQNQPQSHGNEDYCDVLDLINDYNL